MVSKNNPRVLRFLIMSGAVVLTIFIYATYSSSNSLTPPHMRAGSLVSPPADIQALDAGQQQRLVANHTIHAHGVRTSGRSIDIWQPPHKTQQQHEPSSPKELPAASLNAILTVNKKHKQQHHQHHRAPTIDVEEVGAGGTAQDNLNIDEAAMEPGFVSNDLLEEQYVQNADNGNISSAAGVQDGQQLLQQDPMQIPTGDDINQQSSVIQVIESNKIQDSEVLIPTSNLQKFIENADKILKNMTAAPATAEVAAPAVSIAKTPVKEKVAEKHVPKKEEQKPTSGKADEPLPPSAVMAIRDAQPAAVKEKSQLEKTNKKNLKSADTGVGVLTQQVYEAGHMNNELNIERICPKNGQGLKLLILITSAYSHAEARLAIRQTWGHFGMRQDVSLAFMLGRTTNATLSTALTQENVIYGDLIRGNFIDSYNNLTLKTISSLEWVDNYCAQVKYVLKTDDDMFINVPKLLSYLDRHANDKRVIYGRLAAKWKPIRNKKSKYYVSTAQFSAAVYPPFTTGPAYVLTSDIVHELYENSLLHVYLKLEDVFLTGVIAQQLGIKRVHVNEFLNRRIPFNPCNIRKTISVHMIKANEQFDLWKKLLDQSAKCK